MAKPVCLITGATEGVGKATAQALARKGFTVVLAARSLAKAENIKREIAATSGAKDIDIIVGDLNSLRQVRQMAQTVQQRHPRLDLLINNAGIMAPERTLTEDGYESSYQVNYLSHFLLTQLLLDALRNSDQGRIINLSSSVYSIGKFDSGNLQSEQRFSAIGAYAASKLFVLMSTIELAERLRDARITVNAVHPGVVNTHMLKSATGFFKLIALLATPVAVSPEKGADTSVYLATSPDVAAVSGRYFADSKSKPVKSKFNTEKNRTLLWNISMDALRLREPARV
jgi:NAD(P)-dependent dehydrogenase (short-subunit alcohol dehydrogenase family)